MVVRLPSALAAAMSSADGPTAAGDASPDAGALGATEAGAADGAVVAAGDEQAPNRMADVASRPAQRVRVRCVVKVIPPDPWGV
jgi:hypothetical protein